LQQRLRWWAPKKVMARAARAMAVVPMEITLMDSGGNVFILYEFINYVNSYIYEFVHVNSYLV
jgi:hypothetical protein